MEMVNILPARRIIKNLNRLDFSDGSYVERRSIVTGMPSKKPQFTGLGGGYVDVYCNIGQENRFVREVFPRPKRLTSTEYFIRSLP
jgi:hypothetical protein